MDKIWKNSFEAYRKEGIISLIFLWLVFQYILDFAQDDILFTGISDTWGMWCRILYSTVNVFWFGASYWILFAIWMREIYTRNISFLVVSRTSSKRIWSGNLLKKGIWFAFLYPVIHFILLCGVNIHLHGWNPPNTEEAAFRKLFLEMSIPEAVLETLLLRIVVSVMVVIIIWMLFLLLHNVTIAVISSLFFCLISIIMVSFDSFGYYVFFPAGISFYYLLVGGKTVFTTAGGFLIGGFLTVFFVQKYFVQKVELQKLR